MRRIKRTEAIADDLVYTQVQTDGGPQIMLTLVLHAAPFWLACIDPKRVREEIRPEILRYQREVVDVLYAWEQSPKAIAAPASLVPAEQISKPLPPADDADLDTWRAVQKYIQQVHELTGKPYGTMYESLKTAFGVPKYAAIPDQGWPRVVQWFRSRLEQWRKK